MIEMPLWQSRFVVPSAAVELFLAELDDALTDEAEGVAPTEPAMVDVIAARA